MKKSLREREVSVHRTLEVYDKVNFWKRYHFITLNIDVAEIAKIIPHNESDYEYGDGYNLTFEQTMKILRYVADEEYRNLEIDMNSKDYILTCGAIYDWMLDEKE